MFAFQFSQYEYKMFLKEVHQPLKPKLKNQIWDVKVCVVSEAFKQRAVWFVCYKTANG